MISLRPSSQDPSQVARAINFAALIGSRIQTDFPEVADDYRSGRTTAEIVEERNLTGHYGITPKIARNAIGYALGGYVGTERVEPYRGMISSSKERGKLAKKHRGANARRVDLQMQKERRGAYGLDDDARKELSRLGREAQKRMGIEPSFSNLSQEEHLAICRAATIAVGQVPWKEREQNDTVGRYGETEYARRASELPAFQYNYGMYAGRPRWEWISRLVNEAYHKGKPVRTANATQIAVTKARKRSEGS